MGHRALPEKEKRTMKKHFLASALLFASLTAGTLGLGAAQAQEGPGGVPVMP